MFDESGYSPDAEELMEGAVEEEEREAVEESGEVAQESSAESGADRMYKELLKDEVDSMKLVEQFLPPEIMKRVKEGVDKILASEEGDDVKYEKVRDEIQKGVDELDAVQKEATKRLVKERAQIEAMLGNYLLAEDADKEVALEAMGRFALRGIEVAGRLKLDTEVEMEGVTVSRNARFDIALSGSGDRKTYKLTDVETGLSVTFPKSKK